MKCWIARWRRSAARACSSRNSRSRCCDDRADCAVHSLKDVPMELEPGFALPAILTRADPADAFISNAYARSTRCRIGARVGYLVVAPPGAAARAATGPAAAGPARQRQYAPGQTRCRRLRRHRAGVRRRCSGWGWARASARAWLTPGVVAGAGAGRDRDRMRVATLRGCWRCSPRWTTPTRAPAWRPSAR